MPEVSTGWTEEQERDVISSLTVLRQPWSDEFYRAAAPHFALTAIETVFLLKENQKNSVLLHRRPEKDIPQWRGRPASPGSMLRATDRPGQECDYIDALIRVSRELSHTPYAFAPKPVASIFQQTDRGMENGLVFVCELRGEPPQGFWYASIYDLPRNILDHHRPIIGAAFTNRTAYKSCVLV